MTDGEKRFTIGQMAELCNVSAKQLRHYDANGILAPARRDPQSGYRFYTENQIEEILLIQEMHAIGLSLKDIGSLLNRRDLSSLRLELEQGLAAARDELGRARRKYDRTVEVLLRVMHAMEHRAAPLAQEREIRLADVPARTVAFTRYVSSWNAKKLFIQRRAELYKIAARHGLHMTGANMAIFHSGYLKQFSDDPADGEGDLEICPVRRRLPRHEAALSGNGTVGRRARRRARGHVARRISRRRLDDPAPRRLRDAPLPARAGLRHLKPP